MENVVVGQRYLLVRKIGEGSFGEVYIGQDQQTGQQVAVKCEPVDVDSPQLADEYKLYKKLEGGVGIPVAKWYGRERKYYCLVMDLLGPSLEDLFEYCHSKLSMKTVLMLAEQMIDRLEYLHSKNYIHRDLKPENMLMGTGRHSNEVFIIDFGLAKKYWDDNKGGHVRYRENRGLTGTARFTSINSHMGLEQSRRDDMEALGYIFMYFNLKGKLPWNNLHAKSSKHKRDGILESKLATVPKALCRGFPPEFGEYLRVCRKMEFEEKPDYKYLREMMKKLFRKSKYHDGGYVFDWTLQAYNG